MDPNEIIDTPTGDTSTGNTPTGDSPAQPGTTPGATEGGEGEAAESTEVSAGAAALEALEAKFKDTTVDESILGFGDSHCDWRAPLAKVAVFAAAEEAAGAAKKFTVDYDLDGTEEEMTGPAIAAAVLEKFHSKTQGKIDKEKAMSGEKEEENKEEENKEENGNSGGTGNGDPEGTD